MLVRFVEGLRENELDISVYILISYCTLVQFSSVQHYTNSHSFEVRSEVIFSKPEDCDNHLEDVLIDL